MFQDQALHHWVGRAVNGCEETHAETLCDKRKRKKRVENLVHTKTKHLDSLKKKNPKAEKGKVADTQKEE